MDGAVVSFQRSMLFITLTILLSGAADEDAHAAGDAKRGEYLAKIASCAGCHTEDREGAVPYAGGRALKTPFGTFYGPNITPDHDAGIGNWSEADFIQAMRFGVRPDKAAYFPAFPYPSFTKITDSDLQDLWAYLRTLKPDKQPSRKHDLGLFFGWRFPLRFWKLLFFKPGPFIQDPVRSVTINRGAYLVQALGHCGECHTPRNILGAPKNGRFLAGGKGPDGKNVSNITPAHLKKWSDKELKDYLTTGILPDGDVANKTMGEVIQNATSKLTSDDLGALISYLRTVTPVADVPGKKSKS
jgi:mono/diheme cytochrome c family protein